MAAPEQAQPAGGGHWFKRQARDTTKLRAGDRILMPSGDMIEAYIRAIPRGEAQDVPMMRRTLAEGHDAATTCPVTTGIHLRAIAEAAHAALEAGASSGEVVPVWRVLERKASVLRRLPFDPAWLLALREQEAAG